MIKISLVVIVAAAYTWFVAGAAVVKGPVKLSKHPVLLIVSFDGFRADYFNLTETPTMRELMKTGVSVPFMMPQFPTKTYVNHNVIATGLLPDVTGIVDNSVYDPLYSAELKHNDSRYWNYNSEALPFWV